MRNGKDTALKNVSDEAWLKERFLAAQRGDGHAYAEFLERVAGLVRKFLTLNLHQNQTSPDRVEDLVQEILMSIHTKRATYRPDLPVLPWIYAIARHRFIDQFRKERRAPSTQPWDDESGWAEAASEAGAAAAEHAPDVGTLLAGLNDRQRQILLAAKVDEVPLAEIARRWEMSLSAVKVTIHRALKTLRRGRESGSES